MAIATGFLDPVEVSIYKQIAGVRVHSPLQWNWEAYRVSVGEEVPCLKIRRVLLISAFLSPTIVHRRCALLDVGLQPRRQLRTFLTYSKDTSRACRDLLPNSTRD